MPKRSLDASDDSSATLKADRPAQKKTERSHEENQERAYIAASRRADRSIEARVKSAHMASEIHKKRTGKGFKISEKIVQAEEMYEEEEDEMPWAYQELAAHLQTSSPELNYRVNAFLANRVAMASMVAGMRNDDWNQNPINKMFAEQFPHANKQARAMSHRLSTSSYYTPIAGGQEAQRSGSTSATSPMSPRFGNVDYQHQNPQRNHFPENRSLSMDMSPMSPMSPTQQAPPAALSPAMSPGASEHTPQHHTPAQFTQFSMDSFGYPDSAYPDSAFTAELPPEAKMLAGAGLDLNDPMTPFFMGRDSAPMTSYHPEGSMPALKHEPQYGDLEFSVPSEDYYTKTQQLDDGFGHIEGHDNDAGTPALGAPAENWDTYLDWSGCGDAAPEQHLRG